MIELIGINKKFKLDYILRDINVIFKPGEIAGIIGKNGSGKTVLFKIICGYMKPNSGIVKIYDKVIGEDIDFPQNIGVIIEAPGFLDSYSGLKNLEYLASIRKKIKQNTIIEAMETVGLDPNNKKHVGKYSLGMKQKLGIAQAIMENPDILILDEPMNGLDDNGIIMARNLLKKMRDANKIILVASHMKEDIDTLCDSVYRIKQGYLTRER